MLRLITIIFFVAISFWGVAQQPIMQWRDHLPYRNASLITQAWGKVYAATPYALIEVDKESGEVSTLSKVNFLSGLNISALKYSKSLDALMIGYENGNFDIYNNNTFYTMPDIRLADVTGSKKINEISVIDDKAYLSCDFGIVVIDVSKKKVISSYFIRASNVQVHSLQLFQDSLVAVTDQGIFKAAFDSKFPESYEVWKKDTALSNFMGGDYNFEQSIVLDDRLLIVQQNKPYESDSMYVYENNSWAQLDDFSPIHLDDIKYMNGQVLITYGFSMAAYDQELNQIISIFKYPFGNNQPNAAYWDGKDYWFADQGFGVVKAPNSYNAQKYTPEGPFGVSAFRMHYNNGNIYVASGSQTEGWQAQYNNSGCFKFSDEEWSFYNYTNYDLIEYGQVYDFIGIAANPNEEDNFFTTTASPGGLFEFNADGTANQYTDSNSTLQDRNNFEGFYVLTDLYMDDEETLWVINSFAGKPLVAKDKDDNWYSFSLGSGATNTLLTNLTVDYNGVKWISVEATGIIIYDDNETLTDPNDDKKKLLTTGEVNGNLPNENVNTIKMDLNNQVWIGTDEGLAVFYSPQELFDDNTGQFSAEKVLIDGGENTEAVLGKTYITSIDVDGANRKWIGTKGAGVFCLSEDGREEIYHFTEENSPIFSDNITEIQINQKTGEVFISTGLGLLSFRAGATYGDGEFSDVYAFPNPVKPEYSGPITIQGLGFETSVKITDASGNLVNKGMSNGGTFVWDGKDLDGERVSTGVYLVISGQAEEPKGKNVTKIMFIN